MGKGYLRAKQDGMRDFITELEAVSADGFVFPPFLVGKPPRYSAPPLVADVPEKVCVRESCTLWASLLVYDDGWVGSVP